MITPLPTPIYRLLHIDNLSICLERNGLWAANSEPKDGLAYRPIHHCQIQHTRHIRHIRCGPGGTMHDYVPFYFGPRSPMLLQLKTGQVEGYNEGQEPLIYLVSTAQAVQRQGLRFVFSDGHGIAAFTEWFDSLDDLDKVDWSTVYARYWSDTFEDMDKQRRKQAEFLIYQSCPLDIIDTIGVLSAAVKRRVQNILSEYGIDIQVQGKPDWYY